MILSTSAFKLQPPQPLSSIHTPLSISPSESKWNPTSKPVGPIATTLSNFYHWPIYHRLFSSFQVRSWSQRPQIIKIRWSSTITHCLFISLASEGDSKLLRNLQSEGMGLRTNRIEIIVEWPWFGWAGFFLGTSQEIRKEGGGIEAGELRQGRVRAWSEQRTQLW